jgi:hypothetical protein
VLIGICHIAHLRITRCVTGCRLSAGWFLAVLLGVLGANLG